MKENFAALMIGIIMFSNIVTLMGWSIMPGRTTPTPTLVYKPTLLLQTKKNIELYTCKVTEEVKQRACK